MGALIIWFICVWQLNAVQSSGLKLPLTSIACATSATNPKSLSLSFSPKDRIEPKINNIEDTRLKPTDTNQFSKDEKVKKTNSVSKVLEKLGMIDDADLKTKDVISKQRNYDSNLLEKENSSPIQDKLCNMKTADKKQIHEDEINKINYSIKVLSPPTVFNNNVMNLPKNPNKYNLIPKRKKYPNSISQNSSYFCPPKPHEKRKEEFIPTKQKINCNLHKGGKDNKIAPKLNENIKNAGIEFPQIDSRERNKNIDTIQNVKESSLECMENLQGNYGTSTGDVNVNRIPFKHDSQSNGQLYIKGYDIKTNFLDLPLKGDLISDIINNEENTPLSSPLHETATEYKTINDNINFLTSNKHKSISNYYSMAKNEYQKPLSYLSRPSYIPRQNPTTLYQESNPSPTPELIPSPRQHSPDNIVNSNLSFSLDKILSYFTSKFLSGLSSVSATNSLEKKPVLEPNNIEPTNLLQLSCSKDTSQVLSELIPNENKIDETSYLPTIQDDTIKIDMTSQNSPSKPPAPYLSSVTINYIPSMESSNDIIIVV